MKITIMMSNFAMKTNLDYELQNSYIIISSKYNYFFNYIANSFNIAILLKKKILEKLKYKNLISKYASQKARKIECSYPTLQLGMLGRVFYFLVSPPPYPHFR